MDEELICRTCLTKTSKSVSVFKAPNIWGTTVTLSKMIMACAPVEISPGDGLPNRICEICLKHLQWSFLFRMRVLQADKKLRNYVNKNLMPHLQPMNEGILEPLAVPINVDGTAARDSQIFTLEEIITLAENNKDPLITNVKTEAEDVICIKKEESNVLTAKLEPRSNTEVEEMKVPPEKNVLKTEMEKTNVKQVELPSYMCPVNVNNSVVSGSVLVPQLDLSNLTVLPGTNICVPNSANTVPPYVLQTNYPLRIENILQGGTIQLANQNVLQNSEYINQSEYNKTYILIPVNKNENIQTNLENMPRTQFTHYIPNNTNIFTSDILNSGNDLSNRIVASPMQIIENKNDNTSKISNTNTQELSNIHIQKFKKRKCYENRKIKKGKHSYLQLNTNSSYTKNSNETTHNNNSNSVVPSASSVIKFHSSIKESSSKMDVDNIIIIDD